MQRTRVGILRGGPSSEYEVSLKTGASILKHLSSDRYDTKDILIDRTGQWHFRGLPITPERALSQVDVVMNALHGAYGEDGTVQQLLHMHRVPYTGSDALGSAIGMNKVLSKRRAESAGVKTARYIVLSSDMRTSDILEGVFHSLSSPLVVKPINAGSSVGVTIAPEFSAFTRGVDSAFTYGDTVLVEEYIPGREATCGVIEDFRNEQLYALPPIEIRPTGGHTFFDYDAKYKGASEEICPGNFTFAEKQAIAEAAKAVHDALGLRHYSRSDFIVGKRGIYFLEVNTLPGLTTESLLPKALDSVGCRFPDFLDHLLSLAQKD